MVGSDSIWEMALWGSPARELNWLGFYANKFMQDLRPFWKAGLCEPARSALECVH